MLNDSNMLELLKIYSIGSKCRKRKVYCIIARGGSVLVVGNNGTLDGSDCEDSNNNTLPHVLHAEADAISYAARAGISLEGSTLYCNYLPCTNCGLLIVNSGISKVVYVNTSSTGNADLLTSLGVELIKLKNIN